MAIRESAVEKAMAFVDKCQEALCDEELVKVFVGSNSYIELFPFLHRIFEEHTPKDKVYHKGFRGRLWGTVAVYVDRRVRGIEFHGAEGSLHYVNTEGVRNATG